MAVHLCVSHDEGEGRRILEIPLTLNTFGSIHPAQGTALCVVVKKWRLGKAESAVSLLLVAPHTVISPTRSNVDVDRRSVRECQHTRAPCRRWKHGRAASRVCYPTRRERPQK